MNYLSAQKLLQLEVGDKTWPERTQDKWLGQGLGIGKGLLCHTKENIVLTLYN
jgi:hypothetical protein